jgi:hypothetical protein
MFEPRYKPLLPRRKFYHRLARSAGISLTLIVGALIIGMEGYHIFENLGWIDSFANASMILSGMGPLAELKTPAGKIFAGCYALFSGVMFLTSVGVVFTPIFHRFIHKFHLESAKEEKESQGK